MAHKPEVPLLLFSCDALATACAASSTTMVAQSLYFYFYFYFSTSASFGSVLTAGSSATSAKLLGTSKLVSRRGYRGPLRPAGPLYRNIQWKDTGHLIPMSLPIVTDLPGRQMYADIYFALAFSLPLFLLVLATVTLTSR